ncbi:MAG: rhomboid family intramembrane serine protease [Oligoflexales bacterium]
MHTQIQSIIIFISVISVIAFMSKPIRNLMELRLGSLRAIYNPWRFVSYGLIHSDLQHLIMNMLSFWFFSSMMLQFHTIYQVVLVFLAGILLPPIAGYFLMFFYPNRLRVVGASGGCYAVMGAALMSNYDGGINFFGYPMPGFHILLIVVAYDVVGALFSGKDDTWHFGHGVGLVAGLVTLHLLDFPGTLLVLNALEMIPIPSDLNWVHSLGAEAYQVGQKITSEINNIAQSN